MGLSDLIRLSIGHKWPLRPGSALLSLIESHLFKEIGA